MKQTINWLRCHWTKLIYSLTNDENRTTCSDSRVLPGEGTERPASKVYYSTPGRGRYWAYFDNGRIIKPKP